MSVTNRVIPKVVPMEEFHRRLALLETWLYGTGLEELGLGAARGMKVETLADKVFSLSDLYTKGRDTALASASDERHQLAKVLYFLVSDAPKVAMILDELQQRHGAKNSDEKAVKKQTLSLLDLGAGVGASAVGVVLALDATAVDHVEITGVDSNAEGLRLWRLITQKAAKIAEISVATTTRVEDLRTPSRQLLDQGFDLCIAQTVLNELWPVENAEPAAQKEIEAKWANWIESWATMGTTIIIEPALRITTQALQRTRDRLLQQGKLNMLAPCLHEKNCPMLAGKATDWCHEMREYPLPPRLESLQVLVRRRDERLKFSFLALAPKSADVQGTGGVDAPAHEVCTSSISNQQSAILSARLVSDALNSKGKCERVLCSSTGELVRLRLLDRDRNTGNEKLALAERGTCVRISPVPTETRVGKELKVE